MTAAAAAVVLVATGGLVIAVRAEALQLVHQADKQHSYGHCREATEVLDELGSPHRLVAGDIVNVSVQGRRACEVLLDARSSDGEFEPDGLDDYLDHPGARWADAGVVRAALLLKLSDDAGNGVGYGSGYGDWDAPGRDPKQAVEQLAETLAAHPEESASVRDLMSVYVGGFKKEWFTESLDEESLAWDACAAREEYLWLHGGGWTEPELAEPIASTDDRGDDLLAGCAQVKQADEELSDARSLYGEYLETYADAPGAKSVRKMRDELVQSIRHQQVRDRAVANADHPADGSNIRACRDARCQVRVTSGTVLSIGGSGGPYEVLVWVHDKSVTAQLGGYIRSFSTNGGSIVSSDGYAAWSGAAKGELTLNDKVAIGVDGVRGDRATLSVWRVD